MEKTEFSGLYLQLLPNLYSIAVSMLRNRADAEDAVQQTALKAWLHAGKIRSGSEKAYITRILINECHNIQRSRYRTVPVAEFYETGSDDREIFELRDAIARLPEKLRTAFLLVYQEGYSHHDASEALGIHPVALKSRLKRAKMQLRSQLIEFKEEKS